MDKVTFNEEICKSALTELKRKVPYGWDLNIYRGCQHGCKYCYAIYSHKYLDSEEFFTDIHVKTNIVEELEKELRKNSWKRDVINIGGVTDSYQPAEAKYQLMPIIPYITDNYENFDSMFKAASDCKVDYVLPGTLYLRGNTIIVFFNFIKKEFPDLYDQLQSMYKTGGVSKEYKDRLYLMVNELRNKYNLSSSYSKPMKEKLKQAQNIQLSLPL